MRRITSSRWRSPRAGASVIAVSVAMTLGAADGASARRPASPGTYKATGAIRFKFKIKHAKCYLFKLNPYVGRRWGSGLCFATNANVPYKLSCPDGTQVSGTTATLSLFNSRFSSHGVIHIKQPDGFFVDELYLKLHGQSVTGWLDASYQDQSGNTCSTGQLKFKAKRLGP